MTDDTWTCVDCGEPLDECECEFVLPCGCNSLLDHEFNCENRYQLVT